MNDTIQWQASKPPAAVLWMNHNSLGFVFLYNIENSRGRGVVARPALVPRWWFAIECTVLLKVSDQINPVLNRHQTDECIASGRAVFRVLAGSSPPRNDDYYYYDHHHHHLFT